MVWKLGVKGTGLAHVLVVIGNSVGVAEGLLVYEVLEANVVGPSLVQFAVCLASIKDVISVSLI
jgi:hypothetical protein